MSVSAVRLDPATIAALADAVAERLRGEHLRPTELVDAVEIARRFGVSRDYVYDHAGDLGAVRLGDGPRARLRFDPATVAERLKPEAPEATRAHPRRRPRSKSGSADLLPIRGSSR